MINRIINHPVKRHSQNRNIRLSLNHIVTELQYKKQLDMFQKYNETKDIQKGAEILKKIPHKKLDVFLDLNNIRNIKRYTT
jgi:hypothetical protein